MNQIQGDNYQYYQPSYNNYQTSSGQWGDQSYSYGQTSAQTYSYGANQATESTYSVYPSYSSKAYSTPCMGRCNPPKLYADTYNYLTENLMKPVIEEVYHDLKNITSANTVANHSLASKIGLKESGGETQSVPNQESPEQK